MLWQGGDGKWRLVAPTVLSFVGDNPELSEMACVYSSHKARCKCQRCDRLTEDMGVWHARPAV